MLFSPLFGILVFGSLSFVGLKATQWKAVIDFKWIRDNKEAVAANIKNRYSNANLELVIELYDKLMSVQKVRFQFWVLSCLCILLFRSCNFASNVLIYLLIKSFPFFLCLYSSCLGAGWKMSFW